MSVVTDKLADLANALGFGALLKAKISAPASRVETADSALVISNYTEANVSSLSLGPLTTHKNALSDPHFTSTDAIGIYSGTQIDQTIDSLLNVGGLPISRFGSLNYLPINVSGSNEALVDNGRSGGYPMQIEKDGTLVILRLATDGDNRDLFYSYVEDAVQHALTFDTLPEIKYSTRKYRPPLFPTGYSVREVYPSYEGILAGKIINSSNQTKNFICLTNNTLNDQEHIYYEFDNSGVVTALNGNLPNNAHTSYFRVDKGAGNNFVYLLVNYTFQDGLTSDKIAVYRANTGSTPPGGTLHFVRIDGWNSTHINNAIFGTDTYIDFYDSNYKSTPGGTTLIRTTSDINGCYMFRGNASLIPVYDKVTDRVRVALIGNTYFTTTNLLAGGETHAFAFELNLNNQTAKPLDLTWPATLGLVGGVPTVTPNGSGSINKSFWGVFPGFETPGNVARFNNIFYATYVPQSQFQPLLSRAKLTDPTKTLYDLLANPSLAIGTDSRYTPRKFKGALGPSMRGLTYLNADWGMIGCNGYNASNVLTGISNLTTFRNDIEDLSASYHSDSFGFNNLGAVPQLPRYRVSDSGINQRDLAKLIQVTDTVGNVQVSGGWITQGGRINIPKTIAVDSNGVPSGSTTRVVIADSVMVASTNIILTAEGLSATALSSKMEILYMQGAWATGYHKHLVFLTVRTNDNKLYYFVYTATLTVSNSAGSTTITGITLGTRLGGQLASSTTTNSPYSDQTTEVSSGPIIIHEFFEGFVVCGSSSITTGVLGATGGFQFMISMSKASLTETPVLVELTSAYNYTLSPLYQAHPALGVGLAYSDLNQYSDSETKVQFNPVVKTWADLTGYNRDRYDITTNAKTLVTAKDPAGWVFSFPEVLPVIILGKLYSLPSTTINLTTIKSNPANTTFYVFIELGFDGNVSYSVELVPRADTLTSIYIGKVITDASQISSLALEKVTKVAEYRLSATPKGLSIPVAPGNPAYASAIDPNWYN